MAIASLSGVSFLTDFNKAVEQKPNASEFRRRRGMYYASLGEWQLADEDYSAAASGNRSELLVARWTFARRGALLSLMTNDLPGYRTFATEALEQVGDDGTAPKDPGGNPSFQDPHADPAWWLIRLFTVAPDMVTAENRDRLLRMADKLTDQKPQMVAAIHFRNGDAEAAVQLFDQNRLEMPYPFLAAMAHHKQGNLDRAKQLLKEANTWLQQQRDQDPETVIPQGQTWQDWAVYLILQREAESLINGKTEPATASPDDKTSPPPDP